MGAYREALAGADVEADGLFGFYYYRGIRLERLAHSSAQFSYPDSLSPAEWAALEALQMARNTDEEMRINTREQASALERAVRKR